MKTMIESSKRLTNILETLSKETDWKPYGVAIDRKIRLQGNNNPIFYDYLLNNGYKRQRGYFIEFSNSDGVEIVLT